MSLNDDIRNRQLRHTVGLQRLSTSLVRKILVLLDLADADLLRKLSLRGATLEGSLASVRLKSLLQALREINHDAYVLVGQTLRKELLEIGKYEVEFQAQLFTNTLPIEFEVIKPAASMLQAIVTAKPFQGALLKDMIKGMERSKLTLLSNAVRLGMVQGETTEQIIRRIRGTKAMNYKDGVLNSPRATAERLVRTSLNDMANASREVIYKENSDLVDSVQWVATLDTQTCLECADLDGEIYSIGEGPRPPIHINCRCTTTPVVKSWKDLGINIEEAPAGTRASMDGQVSATTTYGVWLKDQPASVQDEALGPTRGSLFRDGGLTIDRFVNRSGDQWTLDELRKREAQAFN